LSSDSPPLIVGTGIAGLWTAWRLATLGRRCVLVTKGGLGDSASAWAQGGIAAAMAPGDSPRLHAADTVAASGGLADPEAVRILTTEGPDRIRELVALGARFDRAADGTIRFGLEAGHSRARIVHAGGDRTGAVVVASLVEIVARHPLVEILTHLEVKRLLVDDGRLAGVEVVRGRVGESFAIPAATVVLATGGVGQLYEVTTNPPVSTGDGWALAFRAGAGLADLEYLQFHPTALKLPGANPAPLISEAVRGAGAYLVDQSGKRFALAADPRGELAPRDIVARAVEEADAEGGAWLDARHLPDFTGTFPGIHAMLVEHGLDPSRDLIPVAPALHYAMGGIVTDLEGRSTLPGLWAAGEVARTGVHGANRLASNSLLEGMVFADRVGRAMAAEPEVPAPPMPECRFEPETGADDEQGAVRAAMRRAMTAYVGLRRSGASLARAETILGELEESTPATAWRTRMQLQVARLITRAARHRKESHGGHLRLDYPAPEVETA
jgi:L-aspartate oxidase